MVKGLAKPAESIIELNDMAFHALHGAFPEERIVGGRYTVSLRLHALLDDACRTDKLADTLDYAAVARAVKDEMSRPSNLIEHVAARIAERLLTDFPTLSCIDVRLCKHHPPVSGIEIGSACFSATFSR